MFLISCLNGEKRSPFSEKRSPFQSKRSPFSRLRGLFALRLMPPRAPSDARPRECEGSVKLPEALPAPAHPCESLFYRAFPRMV